jgi:hypothetical protein
MFRRSPDPISLFSGVAFSGLGLTLLIGHGNLQVHPRWLWPGLLIVLALALLPGVRGHRDHADDAPPPAAPPASGAGGAAEGL